MGRAMPPRRPSSRRWGPDGVTGSLFREIEVIDDEWGKPQVLVRGKVKEAFERHHIKQALISLSHSRDSAIAVIILEQ